jgi:hypothetical protein
MCSLLKKMVASNACPVSMNALAIRMLALPIVWYQSGVPSAPAVGHAELGKLIATGQYFKTVCSVVSLARL